MTYPGDIYFLIFPLMRADGTVPTLALAPLLTIVNLQTGAMVLSPSPQMTLQSGMAGTYVYRWDTSGLSDGTYLAAVTYAADGVVFTNQLLESIRLGDSRVTGQVALQATTAKDTTVAKDATVMHAADYIYVDTSATMAAILAALGGVSTATALTALATTVQNISDGTLGTWIVDKVANTLTMRRPNGATLAVFALLNTSTQSSRNLAT